MKLNFKTILIICLLFSIFKKKNYEMYGHSNSHSLKKIYNINEFEPPNNIVYINTLPEPYYVCNLKGFNDKTVKTINKPENIIKSDNCALYCAHKECGSAMNYYKKNKNLLHNKCDNVYYLKGGAKDLLKDNRFKMNNKDNCDHKINHKH